ncbi:MAG TPA: glycosyltransferase family 9 protein [Dissulfurispiraceae bacterium]|nr:glycosyltransferase family 9 protein [Dissulfurispiraceae bacterium]
MTYSRQLLGGDIRNILVIRMNRIGDMICTIPLLKTLKREFPAAKLSVLAEAANAEVIQHEPYIDRVLVYSRNNGKRGNKLLNIRSILQGTDYDIAIGVKGGFSSFLALTSLMSGARCRLGYVSKKWRPMNLLYNLPVKPIDFWTYHQVEACMHLLRAIGIEEGTKDISMHIPDRFTDEAVAFLSSKGLMPGERLAVFNISSTRENAKWNCDNFIRLGKTLIEAFRCRCIVTGIASDKDMALKICRHIGANAFYFQTKSIMSFAGISSLGNVLVTGEGGAGHVGAAAGCQVISLFADADPVVWRPYGEGHISLKAVDGNVKSITVERVISAMASIDNR